MTKARTLADNYAADINQVTADAPLTGGGTSGTVTVGIQAGTTAQSGAVQLTDSTASTSTTTAATPNSVKSAYDLANGAIAKSTVDAKGDLLVGTANDIVSRLAVASTAGYLLSVDSAEATGLKWAAPASSSGPAFKATGTTNQALTQSTWTKAELGTETFDTDSCYDPTTNYRFTPNKAGYYSFQTTARITHGDASAYYQYGIYKNGTLENLLIIVTAQTSGSTYAASNLIYFNGTTDYAELYVYTQATASQNLDRSNTFFSGIWIRS